MQNSPSLILETRFLECGRSAPAGSSFKGKISAEAIFGKGSKGSLFRYTGRSKATKSDCPEQKPKHHLAQQSLFALSPGSGGNGSSSSGSLAGYTSRGKATSRSADPGKQYYTMSSMGRLYDRSDRKKFADDASACFVDGSILWEFVLSVSDYEQLAAYGVKSHDDFFVVCRNALMRTFAAMGLDPANMIWWMDYHSNTAHPHCHIQFLERAPSRKKGKLGKKELEAAKAYFASEFRKQSMQLDSSKAGSARNLFKEKVDGEKRKVVEKARALDFKTSEMIIRLYMQLPESGRLQYGSSNMIPFRQQLDEIVEELLNGILKDEYDRFVKSVKSLDPGLEMATSLDRLFESEDRKLRLQIANEILRQSKGFDKSRAGVERMLQRNEAAGMDLLESLKDRDDLPAEFMDVVQRSCAAESVSSDDYVRLYELAEDEHSEEALHYIRMREGCPHPSKRAMRIFAPVGNEIAREARAAMRERRIRLQREIAAYINNAEYVAGDDYDITSYYG